LEWAGTIPATQPRVFIATALSTDEEMAVRIANHQRERGPDWRTVEAGVDLPAAIHTLPSDATAIVDCCTVWLGSVWHERGDLNDVLAREVDILHDAVTTWRKMSSGNLCLVTNEVGCGIVPCEPAVRRWRDWAGRMNQGLAQAADRVVLCVCGIPVDIKGVP
jgi:adenosylcobinamide kinase/adenosylcobinamide-phosphate guanylyltransferase